MTQRKPRNADGADEPRVQRAEQAHEREEQAHEREDFERPDAETAAQGGAPHEHARPEHDSHARARNDAEHGYSQDSGYATSGGPKQGSTQKARRA